MKKERYTASVWREGKWFIAQCLEIDIASQGSSERSAMKNLADAIALHFTEPVAIAKPKLRTFEVIRSAA